MTRVQVRHDATSAEARPYQGRNGVVLDSTRTTALVLLDKEETPIWLPANALLNKHRED